MDAPAVKSMVGTTDQSDEEARIILEEANRLLRRVMNKNIPVFVELGRILEERDQSCVDDDIALLLSLKLLSPEYNVVLKAGVFGSDERLVFTRS